MCKLTWRWSALLLLLLSVLGGSRPVMAAPAWALEEWTFTVGSTEEESAVFYFDIKQAGCIVAQIVDWSSVDPGGEPAQELTLAIVPPNGDEPVKQVTDRPSTILPLWISHLTNSYEVGEWMVEVSNHTGGGTATGTLQLEFPPTQTPCDLKAERIDNTVQLEWAYSGKALRGVLQVERSTTGRSWQTIAACTTTPAGRQTYYNCTDTTTKAGVDYFYRVCATAQTACGTTNRTPAVLVAR